MMDTARREHKNDININITQHFSDSHQCWSTNLRYNRNIEHRLVNIMFRKGGVTGLYLGLVVEKANCSAQWFSLAFDDKSDIILTA